MCRPETTLSENPTTSSGKLAPLESCVDSYLGPGMTDPTGRLDRGHPQYVKDPNATLLPTPDTSYPTSHLGTSTSSRLWNGTNMLSPDYPPTHWLQQRLPLTHQHVYNTLDPGGQPESLRGSPHPLKALGNLQDDPQRDPHHRSEGTWISSTLNTTCVT